MFPRLRDRFGTALDLIVEFSTLGEYSLGAVPASTPASAPAAVSDHGSNLGGAGSYGGTSPSPAGRVRVRRTVAGGATGSPPVATPAAQRLLAAGRRDRRPGTAAPPPQPCLTADRR